PSGSVLRISPEEGYSFIVEDMEGNIRVLSHTLNWDLIYNAQDENWYYRSISEGNIIDITTFEIQQ
ncbi:MAG: type II secretion system protein, partial [Actinomycetota bacterium]|nr:type II secretion system protein [Actinomycetota bacterium]